MEEKTKVTILTSSSRIKGPIDLLPGARVTDFMAEARDFIAVINAEVWELEVGGRQIVSAPFINVSRDHIQVIVRAMHEVAQLDGVHDAEAVMLREFYGAVQQDTGALTSFQELSRGESSVEIRNARIKSLD